MEAEAAAHSEGQSDIDDDQSKEEHRYALNIRQVFQAMNSTLGVPTRTEIQSMTRNHRLSTNPFFLVLGEQVDAKI